MKLNLLLRQLYGLLWKNLLIKFHHYIGFSFEIAIPIGLVLLISWACAQAYQLTANDMRKPGQLVPPTINLTVDLSSFNFDTINFTRPIQLCYAPAKSLPAQSIVKSVQRSLKEASGGKATIVLAPFEDESAASNMLNSKSILNPESALLGPLFFGCVIFEDLSGIRYINGSLKYKIRADEVLTFSSWPIKDQPGPLTEPKTKLLPLFQYFINRAFLKRRYDIHKLPYVRSSDIISHRIPYPSYIETSNKRILDVLPSFLVYCYIVIYAFFVNRVCTEKRNQSREMLKMSGTNDAVYWISTILFNMVFFTLISLIMITLVKIPIFGGYSLWANSDFTLILFFLTVYALQLILTGLIVSVLFQKPSVCTTMAVILFIFSLSLASLIEVRYQQYVAPLSRLRALAALPNLAMVLATRVIAKFEGQTVGLSFETFNEPVSELNNLSFGHVIGSMCISCIAYGIILWYLDTVWPWQPGVPKSFYFLFTPKYWRPQSKSAKINNNIQMNGLSGKSKYFEQSTLANRPLAIECNNLTKKFKSIFAGEQKLAVDNINMAIYHGEITCLLGHNGAGKTTTMNMITGMFTPSSGSITVNGYDLLSNTAQARRSMCLCPQHNPLYDELTVRQHLYLYACVKGFQLDKIKEEIDECLVLTDMTVNADKYPRQLSGGMKRKLCLGIALVGGSEILILDEPSSGLDTEARRSMWDSLKRIRDSRTILLTTHDMEEADALGDRIIIMNEGTVRCAGSPLFLKKQLGAGYSLTVSKKSNYNAQNAISIIHKYLPLARVKSDFGSEIVYELREDEESKQKLADFFAQLDAEKEKLGIASFGVSVATLEDVFIKVCDQAQEESSLKLKETPSIDTKDNDGTKDVRVTLLDGREKISRRKGMSLLATQFYSLIIKRLLNAKRSLRTIFYQLILPCFIFSLAFFITARFRDVKIKLTEVQRYNLDMYPETRVFIQSDGKKLSESFASNLKVIVESQKYQLIHVNAGVNMSEYFVSRMSGILPSQFIKSHVFGFSVTANDTTESRVIHTWVNIEGSHAMPVAVDLIGKSELLESLRKNDQYSNETDSHLETYGQPASDRKEIIHFINKFASATWVVFVPFSITFLAASYVIFPVAERQSKAKLIQTMTGLHPVLLHLASFTFDLITNFICSVLLLLFIYLVDTTNLFVSDVTHAFALLSLLMSFGAVSIVLAYIFSLILTDRSKAFIVLNVIYLVSGIILGTTMYTLQLLSLFNIISRSTFDIIYHFAQVTPIFTMTWGFKKIYDNNSDDRLCKSLGSFKLEFICQSIGSSGSKSAVPDAGNDPRKFLTLFIPCCEKICYDNVTKIDSCIHENPFGWTGNRILPEITSMIATLIVYSIVLCLVESFGRQFMRWINQTKQVCELSDGDIDVVDEHERVKKLFQDGKTDEKALTVLNLVKRYGSFYAVRGINFAVERKECFGLLGVNGAGKSTTFGMLTGDLSPTHGVVKQQDIDIDVDRKTYQQNLGYCPQFNPIIDNMTGLEMMYLFGRLRGVPAHDLKRLSEEMIALVDLQKHALRPCGTYSGGNKRKLSIALAMIGNPRLVLLDEPTAGVDPSARRKIWSTLAYIRDHLNCAMILTSHSMNECEALCSRMAIMVKGKFRCLGSAQHLKFRYGQGYTVTFKLKYDRATDEEYLASVDKAVNDNIKRKVKIDQHDCLLVYRVDREEGSISQLFNAMEKLKVELQLEDYTLSDTTLEQIFIQFARMCK